MEAVNMKVNRLPAPTWNWLKMNGTDVPNVSVVGSRKYAAQIPPGVGVSWCDPVEIATGVGPDLDKLLEAAGVDVSKFYVPAGVTAPIRLALHYGHFSSALNAFVLETAENAETTLVMDYSGGKTSGVGAVQTKLKLAPRSTVRLIQVQRFGGEMRFFNDIGAECGEGARLELVRLILDGGRTFDGCRCELSGRESSLKSDVGYLVRGAQRLDMNYVAEHHGKKTFSEINCSGILRESAFKLFRGTIDFRRGAAGSVGSEKEDALLMDDTVVNQTIPLILCEEENVEGNHGATIGRLDDALLFYLESRGMNREAVYEMIAKARLAAICAKISDKKTRKNVETYLNGGISDDE